MNSVQMTDGRRAADLPEIIPASVSTPAGSDLAVFLRLPAREPANVVMAAVLLDRLTAVWNLCGEAGDPLAHPEVVHQLRVASRRSLAALSLFKPLLPRKQYQRFSRWLRKLRRAAGTARDLDVIVDRLQQNLAPATNAKSALHRLLALLGDYQVDSRIPLQKWHHKLVRCDWSRRVDRLARVVAAKPAHDRYGPFVSRRLARSGKQFFATTDRPLKQADDLHRIRIEGKRLRYSLELVPTQSQKTSYTRCLRSLKKMQVALGDFTDHEAATHCFERLAVEPLPAELATLVEELRREEHLLASFAQQKFRVWWSKKRRKRLRRRFSKIIQ